MSETPAFFKNGNGFEQLDVQEPKEGREELLPSSSIDSGQIPPTLYGFLQFFAVLAFVMSLAFAIGGPVYLLQQPAEAKAAKYWAALAFSIGTAVTSGIAAPISFSMVNQYNVKKFVIAVWAALGVNIIFVIIFFAIRIDRVSLVLNIAYCIVFTIFCGLFTPLLKVRNLGRR